MDSLSLFAAVIGLLVGMLMVWLATRNRTSGTSDQDQAERAVELATARERLRALDADRLQLIGAQEELKAQAVELRDALDDACNERAQLSERALRVRVLEEKLAEVERNLAETRRQSADLREDSGRVNAELRAERATVGLLRSELQSEKAQRAAAEQRANRLDSELAELTTRLDAERTQGEEKLHLLLQAREVLANQFKSLANDILEEKAKRFTEQNQANIGQLLEPLKTKLQEFQGKVEEVYVQEGKDRSALAEQVRHLMDLNHSLSQDAKNLTRALKGSGKAQGNWGELVLERVLEASGLRKGEEYEVQESHHRADGTRAQPDVVLHLPEDRHLVVDAKASLTAYEDYASAEDEGDRQAAIKRHLDSVRTHIKGLSDRNYQLLYGLKSLDFVLMFVPIEPAFMLAVTHDRELFMDAWQRNVLLVSPSTLLFVVRTVAHLWRQEAQSRNAQEIARRGAELYDKLVGFVVDLESLGNRLRQAQRDYDEAHGKLTGGRGNLIRQAEMLKQLGVKPSKALPTALVDVAGEGGGETVAVVAIPRA
ncbi:MAG: DNA recombination protein RmuC [Candidatus Accumulibacter phosphatis]|uniref:DNA recombination protein RmuC n=2 Tax=Candidatus Accumulibacter TaxID=327159 RepID=A0A7D5SCJ0_9PROT|nr:MULTISPECIES: DNA recombination protein RmuC [Candidatus Accumulibacter]QLH49162.1 MAG: DNA recombination protein RmuC [Candidatus Accumulibacter cognatus]MBL8400311.1 DNA recombination protein RmuC [Accumulibacter sp.]MBN8517312.1 DNA recombination protein RmuC [Accumulibacter sp.]MBO3709353.1 DNA recombination protein RmuC [Accumulibacter sp.]MCM8580743.1 DNA recombination protein RmuC [Accumulibacter sp.]